MTNSKGNFVVLSLGLIACIIIAVAAIGMYIADVGNYTDIGFMLTGTVLFTPIYAVVWYQEFTTLRAIHNKQAKADRQSVIDLYREFATKEIIRVDTHQCKYYSKYQNADFEVKLINELSVSDTINYAMINGELNISFMYKGYIETVYKIRNKEW